MNVKQYTILDYRWSNGLAYHVTYPGDMDSKVPSSPEFLFVKGLFLVTL